MTSTSAPTSELLTVGPRPGREPVPTVEIAVPVYNEAADLEASVLRLHEFLTDRFPLTWRITIADNASTDATWGVACRLATTLDGVSAVHLDEKGRGRALRAVWSRSTSPVVAYMDVDLSTDLDALLPLVAPLLSGHSDVSIGSRLTKGAHVTRGPRRELVSRSYNLILRTTLRSGFSDAQCGFKALRSDVAQALLPMVLDNSWFFDTELLALAEHNGLRIAEVPVDWVDDPDSRVDIVRTALDDLRGVWGLLRRFARGSESIPDGVLAFPTGPSPELGTQLVRFASIGLVSTALFATLFVLLSPRLGHVGADIAALAICSIANTAANRRLTFALRGRAGRVRHYVAGLALNALPLALTLITLGVAEATGVTTTVDLLVALTAANALASFVRFAALRQWVFRPERPGVREHGA